MNPEAMRFKAQLRNAADIPFDRPITAIRTLLAAIAPSASLAPRGL